MGVEKKEFDNYFNFFNTAFFVFIWFTENQIFRR